MKTKIKICGITRKEDALAISELGVDALGFVFYEKSKRFVAADNIAWLKQIPSFVQTVGLFVNPSKALVDEVCQQLPIELLQFHGNESPAFCEAFKQRYIKAVPMQNLDKSAVIDYMLSYPNACGFLLDNYGTTEMGGSGSAFDWTKIPTQAEIKKHQLKLIMAGGLNADNVTTVINAVKPWAVDVSSGVEISPGIKSIDKVKAFVEAVNTASN